MSIYDIKVREEDKDLIKEIAEVTYDMYTLGHDDGSRFNRLGELLQEIKEKYSNNILEEIFNSDELVKRGK